MSVRKFLNRFLLSLILGFLSISSAHGQSKKTDQFIYERIHYNFDGSVSLEQPSALFAGQYYALSMQSDADGVCRGLNFLGAMPKSVESDGRKTTNTLVVSRDSQLLLTSAPEDTIYLIICDAGMPARVNTMFKAAYENGDGTTTIVKPLAGSETFHRGISRESNINGVCRSFGFDKAIRHSLESYIIYRSSLVFSLDKHGRIDNSDARERPIDEITCLKKGAAKWPGTLYDSISKPGDQVLIKTPYYGHPDNKRRISITSDLDGTCKYFGFKKAVSAIPEDNKVGVMYPIELDKNGVLYRAFVIEKPIETLRCKNSDLTKKEKDIQNHVYRTMQEAFRRQWQ